MSGVAKDERRRRVRETAKLLELEMLLERKPGQLSGGQRQRVAMGRAIVREPSAFLMDEPLSNLDALLRGQMRSEIAQLQGRLGVTTVYVTHDQVEAMTMGTRVAVLRDGLLQQCAPPRELYERPANAFVAGFIGSPPMSLLELEVQGGAVELDGVQIQLPPDVASTVGARVTLGIRPEDVTLGAAGRIAARVKSIEHLGANANATCVVGANAERDLTIIASVDSASAPAHEEQVALDPDVERIHWFSAETGDRLPGGR